MSSVNTKSANLFTKIIGILMLVPLLPQISQAFEIDFSRRQLQFDKVVDSVVMQPANSVETSLTTGLSPQLSSQSLLERVFTPPSEVREIAVLLTEAGFVPQTVYLRKGTTCVLHIVNLHPREKNISVVIDAFTENHFLPFGVPKRIELQVKADGVFSFQTPELGSVGRLVVVDGGRKPAGE